jgi:hypothetical protein
MRRRGLLIGLLMLGAAAPLAKRTPLQTIQELYAGLSRQTPPALLSRRLRALVRRDEGRPERNLDFEWRSGGQEIPQITGFRARVVRVKGDAAVVEASFDNRGERRFRRFFLVREGGRWLIDDALLVPENAKLSDLLKGKG